MRRLLVFIFALVSFMSNAQYGSKQKVFKSFTILNDELEKSEQTQKRSTDRLYFLLFKSLASSPNDSIFKASDSVREKTADLISYINSIKVLLIVKSEKLEKDHVVDHDTIINLRYISGLDDYSTPTLVLIGENRWSPLTGQYSALELKGKLLKYQQFLIRNLHVSDQTTEIGIKFMEDENDHWEITNFYNLPLGGIVTFLSKLQLDVRMAEASLISYWLQS